MRYFLSHIVIVEFRRCRLVLYKKNVLVLRLKYTCLYACVLCVCVSACVCIYICIYVCVCVYIYIYKCGPVYRKRWLRLKCDEIIESLYCHTPCLASGVSFIRYIILDTVTNALY